MTKSVCIDTSIQIKAPILLRIPENFCSLFYECVFLMWQIVWASLCPVYIQLWCSKLAIEKYKLPTIKQQWSHIPRSQQCQGLHLLGKSKLGITLTTDHFTSYQYKLVQYDDHSFTISCFLSQKSQNRLAAEQPSRVFTSGWLPMVTSKRCSNTHSLKNRTAFPGRDPHANT